MKKNSIIYVLALPIIFISCSTASVRVLPGESGVNKVLVQDIEKTDSQEEAVKAATEYCEKLNKQVVFMSDETKYNGDMDESTRNTIRKASTVATFLGGTGVAYSNVNRRHKIGTTGGLLGAAGVTGMVMTSNKDYETEMKFKCQ